MNIVEQFIQSKTGDLSGCEDGIFVGNNYVAVIDGATSTTKQKYDGRTTAQVAKDVLLGAFEDLPEDIQALDGIMQLDGAITTWYRENNIYDSMRDNPSERCFASAVIFNGKQRQLWMVGECQALVDGKHITNNKYVDQLFANVRAFILEAELLKGKTIEELIENDTGRAYILPLLIEQTLFQNSEDKTFGFGTFDGFYNRARGVKTVDLSPNTEYVVLASDGYPELHSTLSQSEDALQGLLKTDPLCFRQNKQVRVFPKGAVSFDDRSYIKIQP
jgi:hypothetical protein